MKAGAAQLLADLLGIALKKAEVLVAAAGGVSRLVSIPADQVDEFAAAAGVELTRTQILRLVSAFYLVKEYGWDVQPDGKAIVHPRDAAARMSFLAGSVQEEFWVFDLDSKHRVIRLRLVHRGSLGETVVHPRAVFAPAMVGRASSILGVHNHPSGDASPSVEDHQMTERLKKVGELVGIKLLDHVVIGGNQYFSIMGDSEGEFRTNPAGDITPGGATLLITPAPAYHAAERPARGRRARST